MSSDLISRQALLKELEKLEESHKAEMAKKDFANDDYFSVGVLNALASVVEIVKSQPTVDSGKGAGSKSGCKSCDACELAKDCEHKIIR